MKLERSITEGSSGWAVGVVYHTLRNKYKKEYHAIYKELDPKSYKEWIEELEKEKRNVRKWQKEMIQQEFKEEEVSKFTWNLIQDEKNQEA